MRRTASGGEGTVVLTVVAEFSFEAIAVRPGQRALAIAFIVDPFTDVLLAALGPAVSARAFALAVAPAADIGIAAAAADPAALAVDTAFIESATETITVYKYNFTAAVRFTSHALTLVSTRRHRLADIADRYLARTLAP